MTIEPNYRNVISFKNIFRHTTLLFLLVYMSSGHAQNDSTEYQRVYKVNKLIEIPATIGLFTSHYLWGFDWVKDKPAYNAWELDQLNSDDIWFFDRIATKQNASYRDEADAISDVGLNVMLAAPVLLMLDKKMRKDWLDLLVLYGETHAINTSLYIMGSGLIDRSRPLMYYPDVDIEERMGSNTQNSFFSGHVSSTASSSFFMAKVYTDYHPELGNKKYWFYAAALIPPAFVGFHRVKALKHFPTDVITGTIMGAAAGILVPHLHKRKKKPYGFSFAPFVGEVNGVHIKYAFK